MIEQPAPKEDGAGGENEGESQRRGDQTIGRVTARLAKPGEEKEARDGRGHAAIGQPAGDAPIDRAMQGVYADRRDTMFGALVLADIDRFKPVNDKHGHPIGDRILQIVSSILKAAMSSNVQAARTGGEEFGIIVTGMSEKSVVELAEEIRIAVEQTPFVNANTGTDYGPITLSFGVCMASEAKGPDDLYRKADRALYASKNAGRNKVSAHSQMQDGTFTKSWKLYSGD